jgi:hypothetical protein
MVGSLPCLKYWTRAEFFNEDKHSSLVNKSKKMFVVSSQVLDSQNGRLAEFSNEDEHPSIVRSGHNCHLFEDLLRQLLRPIPQHLLEAEAVARGAVVVGRRGRASGRGVGVRVVSIAAAG